MGNAKNVRKSRKLLCKVISSSFFYLLIFSERRLVRSHSKGREGFEIMFVIRKLVYLGLSTVMDIL